MIRHGRAALRSGGSPGETLAEVPVRIAEVRVANGASLLFAIGIGSCVAVALWDPLARVGGLAHVMLPSAPARAAAAPVGRYAAPAVDELIRQLETAGAARRRLQACLAGGASMFRDLLDGEGLRLGRRNVDAVHRALQRAGIPVRGEDVFGAHGRSVFLRTTDGTVLVTAVNRPDVQL